jgi:hypothetical protein
MFTTPQKMLTFISFFPKTTRRGGTWGSSVSTVSNYGLDDRCSVPDRDFYLSPSSDWL